MCYGQLENRECKFKAVARADVIHFVNLCAAVFSTLFVIVFYFIVISFFFQYAYK